MAHREEGVNLVAIRKPMYRSLVVFVCKPLERSIGFMQMMVLSPCATVPSSEGFLKILLNVILQ